jgi:tRNA U54 and U55 pseudouridine synthase Pus10
MLGLSLRNKLLLALKEHRRQKEMFAEFEAAIDASQRGEWLAMVLAWESDQAQSNPYLITKTSKTDFLICPSTITKYNTDLTEAQIRAAMAEEEKDAVVSGRVLPHETSPSAFMHLGFSIEETQSVQFLRCFASVSPIYLDGA